MSDQPNKPNSPEMDNIIQFFKRRPRINQKPATETETECMLHVPFETIGIWYQIVVEIIEAASILGQIAPPALFFLHDSMAQIIASADPQNKNSLIATFKEAYKEEITEALQRLSDGHFPSRI